MGLSGSQRKKLRDALIDAFPERSSLERMFFYELETKNLNAIAGGDDLEAVVFNLIKKAEAENWVEYLIDAARKSNPGNPLLKDVVGKIEKELQETRSKKEKEPRIGENSEANKTTNHRVWNGTIAFILVLFGTLSLGGFAVREGYKLASVKKDVEITQNLYELAGNLRNENLTSESDEALRQAGLSFRVKDHNLKQAMLLASMAQAYQNLVNEQKNETKEQKDKNIEYQKKAELKIGESLKYLNQKGNISSAQGLQIKAIVKGTQGNLIQSKNQAEAIKAYQEAYDILRDYPSETNPFTDNQIITAGNIESVHRGLLNLKPNNPKVRESLKEHYYAKLENSLKRKNWRQADLTTDRLMLFIANREKIDFQNTSSCKFFVDDILSR